MSLAKTQLEHWAVLAAVVDEGGFMQAARRLHRSQSAVSYAIARLQEQLGARLLEIEGRRAVLTPHGQTLLRRARVLLDDLGTLEQLSASLLTGWEPELRLVVDAAFPRSLLLNILAELQQRCPNTQLQLSDAVLSGGEEAISNGAADVVVTAHVPPGHLGQWLLDVEFIAVARPTHALFKLAVDSQRLLTPEDLARHTQAVVRDSGSVQRRDEGWLGARQRCTVSSLEASVALVTAGLAYAWLPEHEVNGLLQANRLRALPLVAGARRRLSLSLVLVRPAVAGKAAQAAMEAFQKSTSGLPLRQSVPAETA